MKTKQSITSRLHAGRAFLSAAFLIIVALLPQTTRAAHPNETYTINVTYHRYDGQVGHDGHGGHIYRVKVHHGHHFYYVYLHSALPQLKGHMHHKVRVLVDRRSQRWLQLSVHGNSARIHKVARIAQVHH